MAIRAAEHFILIEYFLIRDDRTGKALAAELIDAPKRGVRVFLIYDYIGSIETPASFFRNMALQGIEITPFNIPSFKRGLHWFDRRDHRKLTVIDGTTAFLGGFNIGDEYSGLAEKSHRFHDAGVSIEGSAVHELVRIFSETWLMERGEMPHIPKITNKRSPDTPEERTGKGRDHQRRASSSPFLHPQCAAVQHCLQFRRDPDRDPLFYSRSPRDPRPAAGRAARSTRAPSAAGALRHAVGAASRT